MKYLPSHLIACALLAGAALPAFAQTPAPAPTNKSWMSSGRGYLGLNVGRSRYNAPCGPSALACDSRDSAAHLYAGSQMGQFWGLELGYLDMGNVARGGGTTRARGLNLSAVGKAPVWNSFGVYGKLGTTYGRTETSSVVGSGVAAGNEHGFGLSYGAGITYDFTPKLSGVLAWDSHDFRFAGSGRDTVRSTSLGLQYRY